MAKEQIAVAELITNIILGKTDGASRVDFFPQKPKFPFDKPYEQPFPRATPESQGISSDMLADLLRDLVASHYTDMHHFMVLRNGKVESAKPTSRLIAAESGMSPIPCAKASQEWLSDFL